MWDGVVVGVWEELSVMLDPMPAWDLTGIEESEVELVMEGGCG